MKRSLLLISLAVFTCGGRVAAQTPTPAPSVILDVQNKGAGGAIENKKDPSISNPKVDFRSHSTTLGVTLRNLDKTPNTVVVEWYFFAKTVTSKTNYSVVGKDFVADSGSKTITLQPGGTETFDAVSKPVETFHTQTSAPVNIDNGDGTTTQSSVKVQHPGGSKSSGWFLRITVNGKVIDAKGSEPLYQEAGMNPKKFDALVGPIESRTGNLNQQPRLQ